MLAILAESESLSASEREHAVGWLRQTGIPYVTVCTHEIEDPRYAANTANRCYYCREHVVQAIRDRAQAHGLAVVVDGFNADDVGDHRPGHQAGQERGVRSPLHEAGFTKKDIRLLARHLGLPNWNKPSMACLASRVTYGVPITPQILAQIERAEESLRGLGLEQLRVRHHGSLARIEVVPQDMPRLLTHRDQVAANCRAAGYIYVALDLRGFRSGSGSEELAGGDGSST